MIPPALDPAPTTTAPAHADYYARNRARVCAHRRETYARNRDLINARQREYRRRNPERARAYQRTYSQRTAAEMRKQTRAPKVGNANFDAKLYDAFDDFTQRLAAAVIACALADVRAGDESAHAFFASPWYVTLASGLEVDPDAMRVQLLSPIKVPPQSIDAPLPTPSA